MSAVFDLPGDAVFPNQRLVLLSIANHANRYGENAFPGRTTIAEETGLSERTVTRATQALRAKGLLEVTEWPSRNPAGQFVGAVVYAVRLPTLKRSTGGHGDTPTGGHADTRTGGQTRGQTRGHGVPVTVLTEKNRATRCPTCGKPLTFTSGIGNVCDYCETVA